MEAYDPTGLREKHAISNEENGIANQSIVRSLIVFVKKSKLLKDLSGNLVCVKIV